MANESIRIRTTPGQPKNIQIKLEQDFDFLEILSLKISQEDLYQTFCSNYGVVVGRVIINKGFGVPNAKVSVFIPISDEDEKNVLLKDYYPYKTPYQKRESDGIRYNLLLSKSTCDLNTPVGSFPTKEEVLDNDVILEVFEKYYKFTTKTNNSGDFMIFGVPVGQHTVHMDVDLSDSGSLSIRPYDMIANGYPEKLFQSKNKFKSSANLDVLPQIITANIAVDVIPFWGDPENCEIGITRVDFDTNFSTSTTALFFGSIFTDNGKLNLNKSCNPRERMGEAQYLKTGKGTIKIIRVSDYDALKWFDSKVIDPLGLEEFPIENGDLIDEDGNFAIALPLNLGHVITNEYGLLVPSPDQATGIPTKGMYRFAMKFSEPNKNPKYKTATLIFPSLGADFGGTYGSVDGTGYVVSNPTVLNNAGNQVNVIRVTFGNSYLQEDPNNLNPNNPLFGPNGEPALIYQINPGPQGRLNGTQDQRFTTDICQYNKDPNRCGGVLYNQSEIFKDFHTFEWKQVYTIAHYIKKFKKGGNRRSFVGLKNTDYNIENPLPFTNAIWKFSITYYMSALLIDFKAFFIKLLILIISFCLRFCLKLSFGFSFTVLGTHVSLGPYTIIPAIGFQICPFAWLGNLIDKFKLPCANAPDGEYYRIPPDGDWDYCNPRGCDGAQFFCAVDCTDGTNGTPNDYNINNNPNGIQFGITNSGGGGVDGNPCLNMLQDWKCCAKLEAAQDNNVIRLNFNDAWLLGSAYLFQFKYKKKVKALTGALRSEKFCGYGTYNFNREAEFTEQTCCPEEPGGGGYGCWKCLLRGAGSYNIGNSLFLTIQTAGITQYGVDPWTANVLTSYLGKMGPKDLNDIVYCNALMSTKIVSLGAIDLCNETLEQIKASIETSQLLQQTAGFYTGTFYEKGWDSNFWINYLDGSSYQDPLDVITYIAKGYNCELRDMFIGGGGCHEYEFKDNPYFLVKEISKIYNTIETTPNIPTVVNPNEDEFGGSSSSGFNGTANPYVDFNNDPVTYGGFNVDLASANKFSPCGGGYPTNNQNCVGYNASNPLVGNWTNTPGPPYLEDDEANSNSWDQYRSSFDRNNINTRSNIPYYYFGIKAGKTALDKLKKEFFLDNREDIIS